MVQKHRTTRVRLAVIAALAGGAVVLVAGCSSSSTPTASASASATAAGNALPPGVGALPGYQVTVFAKGTSTYQNPDSIEISAGNVFVGYQDVTAKDGSDHKTSTALEYSSDGKVKGMWPVAGHMDGLRVDPTTHLLWALADEDANPQLTIIDTTSGKSTLYTFAKTAHGGGFDDITFSNGVIYMSASNPSVANGTNTAPAVDAVTLDEASHMVNVKPILMGNASAGDGNGGTTTINMVDPDSMFINPAGDLTVDNQQGTALVSIHNPGPGQTVTQQLVGTQVDDTIYSPKSAGRLLVSDTGTNTIYAITDTTNSGRIYIATPNDSGVAGFVGILGAGSPAIITPAIIGFVSPHGMGFLPAG